MYEETADAVESMEPRQARTCFDLSVFAGMAVGLVVGLVAYVNHWL